MLKPIYDPGTWPQYLKKKENEGLPLLEVKQKYLKEQLEFENFVIQQQNIIRGVANKTFFEYSSSPESFSIFPSRLYTEEIYTVPSDPDPKVTVREWIKYEAKEGKPWYGFEIDKAYANMPTYFHSYNLVDDPNTYDYDPNGIFGEWIRFDPYWGYWLTVKCSYYSFRGDPPQCYNVAITNFGTPIPSIDAKLEWKNLIGEWDVLATSDRYWNYPAGCYTKTWVGPGEPDSTTTTLIEWHTYTEDPGTATYGTQYCLQEGNEYTLPESWYWGADDAPCGGPPLDYLRTKINAVARRNGGNPQEVCQISDEGDLINGKRYWDSDPLLELYGSNTYVIRIQWTGSHWEMIYIVQGSGEVIQMTSNTDNTYKFPYNEYTGKYGRFDMTSTVNHVPWTSHEVTGIHIDINYGSAPPP